MRIIVCIKQVPETTEIKLDPVNHTLIREGVTSIINPLDEHALEEALRLRETLGGEVTAVTMGPPQAEEALRRCLVMGADRGVLLTDRLLAGSDTLATGYALAKLIDRLGFDLIICGQESSDSGTGQVGPSIAEYLGIPHVTYVKKIEKKMEETRLLVFRETEFGYDILEVEFPCLLAVLKGINTPRSASREVPREEIIRFKAMDINCAVDLVGLDGSPTRVIKVSPPKPRRRECFSIDSKLPANERIKLILAGGVREKDERTVWREEVEEYADKVAVIISSWLSVHS